MPTGSLLAVLTLALSASFLFWILLAYGTTRWLRFGVCSVCGAVVSVWGANLVFEFLPGWITLLLMGQSVTGGATLLRDMIMVRQQEKMEPRRYFAVAQLTFFAFVLGGTLALGSIGLVFAVGG